METVLVLIFVFFVQIIVYVVFLRSRILSWGASEEETKMSLIGDHLAPSISATRAITINAPKAEVWKWIIQLGADRGGFFSYAFIEKVLGYEKRDADLVAEFQDMEVGRIIPGSIDESKSVIKYNFPVVAVEHGKFFVLENWGTFFLKEISSNQTRLIVRTHAQEHPNLIGKIGDFIGVPLHHIMERRMLMGFKAQAEDDTVQRSSISDNLWLLGVLLSAIGIVLMAAIGDGLQGILIPVLLGVVWLWILLIFDPKPKYSMTLLLIEILIMSMSAALAIN